MGGKVDNAYLFINSVQHFNDLSKSDNQLANK